MDDPVANQDNLGLISAKVKISGIHSGFNITGMGILGLMFPDPVNEPEKIIAIRHEYDRINNKETIKTTWEKYRLWNLWQEDIKLREKYKKYYDENDDFYKKYPPIK